MKVQEAGAIFDALANEDVAKTKSQKLEPLYHEFEQEFFLSENIYIDKMKEFEDLLSADRPLVADILGAAVCSLFNAGFLNTEHFVRSQLDCCRNTVASLGFREISKTALSTMPEGSAPMIVLMPGCQDSRMIGRRVQRLYEFSIFERRPFTVIFSGGNPGTPACTIENEAEYMQARYEEMMDCHKDRKFEVTFKFMGNERKSKTTKQNIDEFLGGTYLHKSIMQTVVVISSTFHLIRIAERLRECVEKNEFEVRKYVDNFILIGAEHPATELPVKHWDKTYIKLMMFDLYRKHMH
jgi:hypothetical protein